MRRINEIKNLPISELSDEEICKAAMYRLEAKALAIVYLDTSGHSWWFYRYKNRKGIFGGHRFCTMLIQAWEKHIGVGKKVTNKNKP